MSTKVACLHKLGTLCASLHCVALCGTALYFAHVGHCTCGNPPFSAALSPTMHFGSFADQGTSLAMQKFPLTMDREVGILLLILFDAGYFFLARPNDKLICENCTHYYTNRDSVSSV